MTTKRYAGFFNSFFTMYVTLSGIVRVWKLSLLVLSEDFRFKILAIVRLVKVGETIYFVTY